MNRVHNTGTEFVAAYPFITILNRTLSLDKERVFLHREDRIVQWEMRIIPA